jgi:hypothetical protein
MNVTFRELEPFYGEKTYLSALFVVSPEGESTSGSGVTGIPELQQLEQSLVQEEGGQKEHNKDGGTHKNMLGELLMNKNNRNCHKIQFRGSKVNNKIARTRVPLKEVWLKGKQLIQGAQ